MSIKRNAEDLVAWLEPISKALDKIQSDKWNISDSVLIRKELIDQLEASINKSDLNQINLIIPYDFF